jgi:hypothetical protein
MVFNRMSKAAMNIKRNDTVFAYVNADDQDFKSVKSGKKKRKQTFIFTLFFKIVVEHFWIKYC